MSEITTIWIITALQILIAFGLVNVWLVRSGQKTKYRGGNAQSMKDEFAVYGLPPWSMYVVGVLKMLIALIMLIVIIKPYLMNTWGITSLVLLSVLMCGAISMHVKVKDSLVKVLPAISMLAMALMIIYLVYAGF